MLKIKKMEVFTTGSKSKSASSKCLKFKKSQSLSHSSPIRILLSARKENLMMNVTMATITMSQFKKTKLMKSVKITRQKLKTSARLR